jgi:hypothetical protein
MIHKKHPRVYRRYWQLVAAAICFIIALIILALWFTPVMAVDVGAKSAPTPTPVPTLGPLYIDMQHGQRMHVRCGFIPDESDPQPAGQFTSPQFGIDVFVLDCGAFGSARVGE